MDKYAEQMKKEFQDAKPFIAAYLECALWSSSSIDERPLDESYSVENFTKASLDRARRDCLAFLGWRLHGGTVYEFLMSLGSKTLEKAGHDFWLTRNGHGSGFWDRPEIYGEYIAQYLTELSIKFQEITVSEAESGVLVFD